jgi:hypothetical protein
VTPLLLDEHLADKNLARQLRAAGCVIETPQEAGLLGLDDPSILEAAIPRGVGATLWRGEAHVHLRIPLPRGGAR